MTAGRAAKDEPTATAPSGSTLRIGEAAKLCGVTTRTLRYWEEIGLLAPSEQRHGSERVYLGREVERAQRIKELQELMGFSLAEIRVVLETEDIVGELRTAYKANARPDLQRQLLANAMEANDKLVARLDNTLARVSEFRDERVAKARRMRRRAAELDRQVAAPAVGKRGGASASR
ncbi:MAG TPA: MerR family transcriptional regulator [Acidimicrobiales bacterium]|nr:MerR family transcriptional regulator [Acidimicrobiales bacterium]